MVPDVNEACARFEKLGVPFKKKPNEGNSYICVSTTSWYLQVKLTQLVACRSNNSNVRSDKNQRYWVDSRCHQ